ncbi:MAG: DUF4340 domain-containing protein [Gammaproteobacteria bacterium]|nr:DUF4340 domain-containing protein [Gammaproteobacteria bacterium]
MGRTIGFVVLVLVTAGLVYAAYSSYESRDRDTSLSAGELFFPKLVTEVNATTRIRGQTNEGAVTIRRVDDNWVVEERGGYLSDRSKVQQLLIGLSNLRRVEKKTAKPERYAALGLEEPGTEGSNAQGITLENESAGVLASLILGDRRPSRRHPSASEFYVRVPGDPQAWMAEGSLPNVVDIVGWLDEKLFDLDGKRVERVTVRHADGETVAVIRRPGQQQEYQLQDIPAGRKVASEYIVRSFITGILNFSLDDVAKLTPDNTPEEQLRIDIDTYDGMRVSMFGSLDEDAARLQFKAAYMAAQAEHEPPAEEKATDGDEPASGAAGSENIMRLSREAVEAEVKERNSRWASWLFEVGDWRLATATKRMDELLEPLEQKKDAEDQNAALPEPGASPVPAPESPLKLEE